MGTKQLIIFVLLTGAFKASAQQGAKPAGDTTLKGSTIEVIQAYKPKVKQSPKPEWVPQLPAVDTSHPQFNYDVPQQALYYSYNSLPLQPLALGHALTELPFANYIKAGGGNLSTIFLDAGIGGIYGANYETGIHLHHISQNGNIKYQQAALTGIEAEGVVHNAKTDWHAGIDIARNQYNYYGYDHSVYDNSIDSIRQRYTLGRLVLDFKNRVDSNTKFFYNPGITASLYRDRYDASEVNLGFNLPFVLKIDNTLDLKLAITGAMAKFKNDKQDVNNSMIAAYPGLAVHSEHIDGHALLGFARGMDDVNYFLPDVKGEYKAKGNKFMIGGGWKAELLRNTYEQLSSENPYMLNRYTVAQSRKDEVFGEFQGRGGDHFTFSGKISWLSYSNLPVFLNKWNTANDWKYFTVLYENVKAISFQPAARYSVANKWSVGATGEFYSFYNIADQQYVWHTPSMKVTGDFTVTPTPKLTCTAYLSLMGGIHAKDYLGNSVDLPAIFDLGGNAEYQVIPRLSLFAQLNNLLNYKYQRWYKYEVYGLNIYGGLRVKF